MNNASSALAGGLIVIAVWVVLFLVFREVFCWYWKINQLVALQRDSLQAQVEIRDLLRAQAHRDTICAYCREPVSNDARVCPHCGTAFKSSEPAVTQL